MSLTLQKLKEATRLTESYEKRMSVLGFPVEHSNGSTPPAKKGVSDATRAKLRRAKKAYWRKVKAGK